MLPPAPTFECFENISGGAQPSEHTARELESPRYRNQRTPVGQVYGRLGGGLARVCVNSPRPGVLGALQKLCKGSAEALQMLLRGS